MEEMLESTHFSPDNHGIPEHEDAIAIIGMAARLPQEADTNDNLWKFLLQARNSTTPVPDNRFNHEAHYHPDHEHAATYHTKGGHFIAGDIADFDSRFFNITNTEAMTMDPHQRVTMENVYHALENAGIPISKAQSSKTSVFVSCFNNDFCQLLNHDSDVSLKYKPTGVSLSIIANRISWFYDFKGSSVLIDTACSSSMVAFHLACQNLRNAESNMAVVSGVNVMTWPNDFMAMSYQGFLSPDGKCYSFDDRANGYSRGEGVCTVILKKLSDAIRDGETIRAVVRGSGVNQDGRTAGISLPNGAAQVDLIRDVYARAGLDPEDTLFVESHGTGTRAGDPIEARAISEAFRTSVRDTPLYIGAMKPAVGHLEAATGIASIIKSVMILESSIIPPNANFEKVNSKIPVDEWKLQFPVRPTPWPGTGTKRISMTGMGFGGTNAHVILDDASSYLSSRGLEGVHKTVTNSPSENDLEFMCAHIKLTSENEPGSSTVVQFPKNSVKPNGYESENLETKPDGVLSTERSQILFMLSSLDENGVSRNAKSLSKYLRTLPPMDAGEEAKFLADLAYTVYNARTYFPWRSFCVASTLHGLVESLEEALPGPVRAGKSLSLGFVFTGQGAQWYAMGRELMVYSEFRKSLEHADEYMRSLGSSWSLLDELRKDRYNSNVNRPDISQAACAALQVALVDHLAAWNILPSRVIGHSSGEIAAAYSARKISRKVAWKVAYFRGVVCSRTHSTGGAMLAVGASEDDLQPYMMRVRREHPGELAIACYNSPHNHTISGTNETIDALQALLSADSVFARKLTVSNAYHSSHMETVAREYFTLLGNLKSTDKLDSSQEVHMFSTVMGRKLEANNLEMAGYWVQNLASPVMFAPALVDACFGRASKGQGSVSMGNAPDNVFLDDLLEIGPHGALRSAIKQTINAHNNVSSIDYLSFLTRNISAVDTALTVAGSLSNKGYPVDIRSANEPSAALLPEMLVNLPPYEFDHSSKLWYETRLSKNHRLRSHPIHDLFGVPVTDWNTEEPQWRHVIRLSENPWIREHVVTGNYTYPGVGYIVMAIEAAKQITDPKVSISGYSLRDVSIKAALNLPDTKHGIEVALYMTRMDESSMERSKFWWNFRIMSFNYTEYDWIEHCTGYIEVEAVSEPSFVDAYYNPKKKSLGAVAEFSERCNIPFDMPQIYDNLSEVGLEYGPLFKNLSDVKAAQGRGEALGTITIPDVASSMPKSFMRPHVIHPCTFDSMLHVSFASTLDSIGVEYLPSAMVPTFIRKVWVSSAIESQPGHSFLGHGRTTPVGPRKFESDITVWDENISEIRMSMEGLKLTALSNTALADKNTDQFCHTMEWKPDIELFKSDRIPGTSLSTREEIGNRRREVQDLQLAAMLMIMDSLEELKDVPISTYEGHFRKYYEWLLHMSATLKADSMIHLPLAKWMKYKNDKDFKESFYGELEKRGSEGQLCVRMGTHIAQVLRNEVDPLRLMFESDDLMDRIYAMSIETGDLGRLTRGYLDMVGHDRSDLKILEIGAGTGSLAAVLLESLNPVSAPEQGTRKTSRIAKYVYTDISAAFFEKAQERFKDWRNVLDFQTLDVERSPEDQGFVREYDIVVAGNVLHATADLRKTLANVRDLLKPGGRLIIQEGIRGDFAFVPLSFGMLEGWWSAQEDTRKWCAFTSENEWAKALEDTGFSGIDMSMRDSPDPNLHWMSVLSSSVVEEKAHKEPVAVETLIITAEQKQDDVASLLVDRMVHKYGLSDCSIIRLKDIGHRSLMRTVCVSLIELEYPMVADPTEEEYDNIRHLLSTCEGLLWVTGDPTSTPEFSAITGLMRSVRWERDLESPNLVALGIADPRPSSAQTVQTILDIFDHQYVNSNETRTNAEYVLQGDIIYSNRLVNATEMNDYLASKTSEPKAQMVALEEAEAQQPLRLTTGAPGMLNELQFQTDPVWYTPLGELDVEIKIKAVGLNFRDIMIAMGEHNAITLGNEAAGIVTRVGSRVTRVDVGDHVVYLDGHGETGTFQTYGRVIEILVVKIPKDIKFEVAASLPTVYVTSLYGLYDLGSLSKGESVLIHAAAGGVGQAAITLANLVGAKVFATVSTKEKADILVTRYGVKRDHIFSSRDLSFADRIMDATNGRGVDVILNSLAGEFLRRTWECIAPFGRFIEIGKKDAQNNGRVSLNSLLRNIVMASVELPTIIRNRPEECSTRLIADTIRLYTEGKIKEPYPLNVVNYSGLEDAFRVLQSGKHMGKTVLVPTEDSLVPVVPRPPEAPKFKENASYLLSGGLGGIGGSVALWMASRGAKNIILLSRSGPESPAAQGLNQELENRGVRVRIIACDVTDKAALSEALKECQTSLPPIKGCIQGAMVIADKIFENMTYEKFRTATRPKIQGSWNLHCCLPRDMDFFVLLSSVVGLLGNRGQANYAAGNTFQDALAAHRASLGLPAVSLDLGQLLSVGYIANNREKLASGKAVAGLLDSIKEEDIHSMIECHIDPAGHLKRPTQIASALTTAKGYMSQGTPVPSWMYMPLFNHLASTSSAQRGNFGSGDDGDGQAIIASLASITSLDEGIAIIAEAIRNKLSKLLSIHVDSVDASKSVSSNGVDSLVAVEFRVWLAKVVGADIPLLDIMGTMPIAGPNGLSAKAANISNNVPAGAKSGGEKG